MARPRRHRWSGAWHGHCRAPGGRDAPAAREVVWGARGAGHSLTAWVHLAAEPQRTALVSLCLTFLTHKMGKTAAASWAAVRITVLRCLMTGLRPEKGVVRRFRHRVTITEGTRTRPRAGPMNALCVKRWACASTRRTPREAWLSLCNISFPCFYLNLNLLEEVSLDTQSTARA